MLYKRETFTNTWPAYASCGSTQAEDAYNYLHQYDSKFTLDTTNWTIGYDDKFKIYCGEDTGYQRPKWSLICSDNNETQYNTQTNNPTTSYWFEGDYKKSIFIKNKSLIYFAETKQNASFSDSGVGFIYVKTKDNKHYATTLNPRNQSVNDLTFYNVITGEPIEFQLIPFVSFAMPSEKVLFSKQCIILSQDTGYCSFVNDLRTCSNLTVDTVITITGRNYYVLGTNLLVPLFD